ncbi:MULTISPECIES: ABC transporter substrate-binding protein [unclassified Aureimonas]|uniref:ABC transporter substrate-binding protein n=1 Tax=unclassified Aureimonas TaxID=2615206 RepID=UPI0006F7D67B|nr:MULTISPECIES: ABC transporter substrate-binding protein [unclassified Aureimonas]KQT70035.1 ABC transporter ATP-binding protein [Aureimonas sp. Leaf427]KQT76322.1 ABC transporter ATP-binding protein [Aureimonas sp. Leaf460]
MRRSLLAAGFALAAAILPAKAEAAEKLSVLLEWFVNPDHAPLVVAKQLGLFEKAGLDVELIPPADPSAPPRLVAAKQADIALHYQPNLFLDVENGLPLVRFGTLVETPLSTVMVLADGPIKSLADLKGKRVGYSVAGFEDVMVKRMLEHNGIDTPDVELINVNFSLSPSLIAGSVDAVVGAYRNFELTQLELQGRKGLAFYPEENGVPAYDELIYVTHRDLVADKRLPKFLDAVEAATIYLTNHPQEGWELFVKAYPDLNDELNRRAWFDTLPRFAKHPAALDVGSYERFGAFMKETGLIKSVPPLADMAVALTR